MFLVFGDAITLLTVSLDNKYLIAGDVEGTIMVWVNNTNSRWEKHCKLPKYKSAPTSISVQPHSPIMVVVYANQKVNNIICYSNNFFLMLRFQIIEFDLRSKQFTKFSRNLPKTNVNKSMHKLYPIRNVSFDPSKQQLLILQDDTSLIVINKEKVS